MRFQDPRIQQALNSGGYIHLQGYAPEWGVYRSNNDGNYYFTQDAANPDSPKIQMRTDSIEDPNEDLWEVWKHPSAR